MLRPSHNSSTEISQPGNSQVLFSSRQTDEAQLTFVVVCCSTSQNLRSPRTSVANCFRQPSGKSRLQSKAAQCTDSCGCRQDIQVSTDTHVHIATTPKKTPSNPRISPDQLKFRSCGAKRPEGARAENTLQKSSQP